MTAPLTLDEFTAALREAFPDAVVTKPRTSNQRWSQCHAASLVARGQSFIVDYSLDPIDPSKRWHVECANGGPVATASQLRPLLVDSARYRARVARADAAEAIERAERLEAAAKLIEGGQ